MYGYKTYTWFVDGIIVCVRIFNELGPNITRIPGNLRTHEIIQQRAAEDQTVNNATADPPDGCSWSSRYIILMYNNNININNTISRFLKRISRIY